MRTHAKYANPAGHTGGERINGAACAEHKAVEPAPHGSPATRNGRPCNSQAVITSMLVDLRVDAVTAGDKPPSRGTGACGRPGSRTALENKKARALMASAGSHEK